MPKRYDWVGWLGERDAQVLLLWLMQGIEEGTSLESLRNEVEGWRVNAHKALTANDYRACVDKFLEVFVDARVHVLNTRNLRDPPNPACPITLNDGSITGFHREEASFNE